MDFAERTAILRALAESKGSMTAAAKLLGIGRTTLYRKIQRGGVKYPADSPKYLIWNYCDSFTTPAGSVGTSPNHTIGGRRLPSPAVVHGELEKLGYNFLEACDGADALVIAELHPGPIDVIVTDVIMPNVNGVALVQRLLPILPDVKVIYISGFPGVLPSGIDYLAKPFKLSDLVNNINNLTRDVGFGTVNLPQQETNA